MEVQFPSGFTADLDTLPSLEVSENVMKVETKNGHSTVIVYFDHLSRKEICPTLDAFRTQKVAEQRPASVTIYDYYDSCTFKICSIWLFLITSNLKFIQIFCFRFFHIVARRARMFYKMREATLCDICEGTDCSDTCQIRASKQRSGTSAFDDEEQIARVTPTSHSSTIQNSIFILVATFSLKYLTN